MLPNAKVLELRRQEEIDPPVPAHVIDALDAAEEDLRLLDFKYAVLVAVSSKARAGVGSPAGEKESGGDVAAEGDSELTEEALKAHLAKHVS